MVAPDGTPIGASICDEINDAHLACSRPARRGRPPKLKNLSFSQFHGNPVVPTSNMVHCCESVRIGGPPKPRNHAVLSLYSADEKSKQKKGGMDPVQTFLHGDCSRPVKRGRPPKRKSLARSATDALLESITTPQLLSVVPERLDSHLRHKNLHETTLNPNHRNAKKHKGNCQIIGNVPEGQCFRSVQPLLNQKQRNVPMEAVKAVETSINPKRHCSVPARIGRPPKKKNVLHEALIPLVQSNRGQRGRPSKPKAHSKGLIDFGPPKYVCEFCNAFHWLEERLTKYKASDRPRFSMCCKEGKIQVPRSRDPPQLLKSLLNYEGGPKAKRLRETIRPTNCRFAFSSFGAKIDNSVNLGRAPPIFRISGQNCHRMGSLLPVEGAAPQFAQLYIYDTDNEVANRLNAVPLTTAPEPIDIEILTDLKNMFDEYNELVKVFRTARDMYENDGVQDFKIKLLPGGGRENPQYSDPQVAETVALIVGTEDELATGFDIIIQSRSGQMQRIGGTFPAYMALQYPILFPRGEPGYHNKMMLKQDPGEKKRPTKISMCDYYRYQLQFRKDEWSTIMHGGRLKQQYEVDAYCSVEAERLNFHRFNQKDVRLEFLNGLVDAVNRGDMDGDSMGRKVVLPSSFTGGPRYMGQVYQDAMAICRRFGNPDFFITFTCNVNWNEIQEALKLYPGQKVEDRADLPVRVFKLKVDAMMKELKEYRCMGSCKAVIYAIEFQKRGLPHVHIVQWVTEEDKCNDGPSIDKKISAILPDPVTDPEAYELVTTFMMHGPCGERFPKSPCMIDGKCSKGYPKQHCDETVMDSAGYPTYKRPIDGRFVMKNGFKMDNGWVVPYNLGLLQRFKAHINVEKCCNDYSVKYLFKYIHKGNDMKKAIIQSRKLKSKGESSSSTRVVCDEISAFLDCRFITPGEANWRLNEFHIHHRYPSVERLHFHLEGQQMIAYAKGSNVRKVVHRQNFGKTMFTAWMEANREYAEARELTYPQFPSKWTWHDKHKCWSPRQQGYAIGRMFYVPPTAGEQYFFRLLLNVVPGATCYADIRTFEGITYDSYREACNARGMLGEDVEWEAGIIEASQFSSGDALRHLFVMILIHCPVADCTKLFDRTLHLLAEGLERRRRLILQQPNLILTDAELRNGALLEIEHILTEGGNSLQKYGMPKPDKSATICGGNSLILEERNYDRKFYELEHSRLQQSLNPDQMLAYDEIMKSVKNNKGRVFFVYGQGGTGKTYLWNTLLARIKADGGIALPTASSGIAAILLPRGRTAHSRFNIPPDVHKDSTCNISKAENLAELIQESRLIIWDEAPMDHRHCFEAVSRTLQDLMNDILPNAAELPFGGKTVVLGGDFRQCLPVIPKATRHEIVDACINKSLLWSSCTVLELKQNMRLFSNQVCDAEKQEVKQFADWVQSVGDGTAEGIQLGENEEGDWIPIPDDLLIPNDGDAINNLIEAVYPDFKANFKNGGYLKERAIVTPKNMDVNQINARMLDLIDEQEHVYLSYDHVMKLPSDLRKTELAYPDEYLNSMEFNGLPAHELRLKVGTPVILMRNLNQSQGLCNGTRMVITNLASKVIAVQILTGSHVGTKCVIPRIELSPQNVRLPFIFKRRQYPIRVCLAMTINKAQGQTLKCVGVYLPKPVFSHGQLYVAISRVQNRSGLKILIDNSEFPESPGPNYTKNVVYKEVFDNVRCQNN